MINSSMPKIIVLKYSKLNYYVYYLLFILILNVLPLLIDL